MASFDRFMKCSLRRLCKKTLDLEMNGREGKFMAVCISCVFPLTSLTPSQAGFIFKLFGW